jgi:type I restriction enzyme S subunit
MSQWDTKPLGEVCTIKPPKAEARTKLADDDEVSFAPMEDLGIGVKYMQPLRTRQFGEVSGSYTYFADGDVLLAKITPCFENGKLGVARDLKNGVGFGSSEYIVLRPNPSLDAEFLYYYLARPDFLEEGARSMTGAVGHKRVSKEFVENYQIPLPPVSEQRRIVAILDEAFEGIATAKANAEENLQNARELFDGCLQAIFSKCGKDWVSQTVQQWVDDGVLAKPQDGNHGEIHPVRADYVESGVPFIMAADLIEGVVDTVGCRFIAEKQARALRIGFAKSDDVLLSHKGTIGRVAILDTRHDYVVLTPQVTYYRCLDRNRVFNGFLYYCLLSPEFQAEMGRIAGAGSTRAYIGITRQLDLRIVLPPVEVQHEMTSRLKAFQECSENLIRIYTNKISALEELKKSLLHQAFTGQL